MQNHQIQTQIKLTWLMSFGISSRSIYLYLCYSVLIVHTISLCCWCCWCRKKGIRMNNVLSRHHRRRIYTDIYRDRDISGFCTPVWWCWTMEIEANVILYIWYKCRSVSFVIHVLCEFFAISYVSNGQKCSPACAIFWILFHLF